MSLAPTDDTARRRRPGRKYTSRACETCRQRRAKCDGVRPSCSRCLDRGVQCQYSTAEDGRQPAPKSYVVMLRNRIELLERVLHSRGIDPDAAIQLLGQKDSPDREPDAEWAEPCSNVDDLCTTFDGALTLDESLNFDQDGEVRYFGPTSGRLLFRSSSKDPPKETHQTDGPCTWNSGTACASQPHEDTDLLAESLISDELKSHLIDLYFEWEQPWLQMVNEQLFRDSMKDGGRYFSPLLLNCILAMGSRYCKRMEIRSDPSDSNTAGRVFIKKAEALIQNDLKWPKITTIQSLAILGMAYIAMGSDAAGWLHQGMANRLALDMGLNMDPSVLSGAVALPSIEIELRRQIYWALYCHDKLSASYTGRVCTLLDSQGVVNKPFALCAPDVCLPSANGNGQLRAASQRDVVQLHRAMIDLCRIFEKVLLAFWSPKPLLQATQRSSFFESCVLDLRTWYYDLAQELKIDRPSGPSRFPHTYTLCMVYHTVYILLCIPFLKNRSDATGACIQNTQGQHDTNSDASETRRRQKAITISDNSARAVCVVAQKYRQTFGSFKLSPVTPTHCMLSAALIIIEKCSVPTSNPEGTQAKSPSPHAAVGLCLEALRELSTSWDISKRIGRNLEKLYCQRLNCNADQMPSAPSLEFNASCAMPCQPVDPTEMNAGNGFMAPPFEFGQGISGPNDLPIQDSLLTPPLATIHGFDSSERDIYGGNRHGANDFGIGSNPDEHFVNNLGFAFSADSLPSDYNMFDTLNQMYLEDMW
ncbi:hypothetical protein N7499_004352 [Penicillium canescens]|uniref:uncharacterized protein n=1 Tax=Penicillium canescens TaxID=5083 RepID=UPI0026DF8289|nr:uncharacterized protein N7446_005354 [Penicillium canescens]KAJ6039389.1 hypothetical protein N7444_008294 [Penicillium canescens]KAJ6068317.1 hypothetical protein N7446_005354 [Penicillium canescens]KAJ6084723.1 hypothetical protein N7499_004352 [Penicillium canescens]KAJ6161509.1 hypothetical protein N7485_009739 [Penicillium canescens]